MELGGDFGGVWYWNRYPGIQVDTDSYCYLPLLEETGYMPKQKYSHGDECFEHGQRIGKHFGLYDKAVFGTLIHSIAWDEEINRWRIGTNRVTTSAPGSWSCARDPSTGRNCPASPASANSRVTPSTPRAGTTSTPAATWRGGLDGLAGKRVAIVGTGASGSR